ncbi:antitrypsin-like isoform X5 [Galleria mellonella]|uniref:Antitrypsin-like isoform X5 n=1 Tax=Galleria mellonella TaxID=7137 RepID=A0ABM3MQU2_GALME|nr:antitrypsin-like isoform X5 [Galleria mellonella]
MRTTIYTLVLLFLVIQVRFSSTDMDAQGLSREIIKFSAKFCNELNKNASVISSPLSAEYLLALLALGTSDTAHSELLTSLGIPDDDSIRSSFSSVSSKLKSIKGVTLNVANNVYIMEGDYDLVPELKKDAITVFDAGIEKINFSNGAAAATHINQWGTWEKQFEKHLTSDQPFNVNNNTKINVPMMFREDTFWYGESEGLQAQLLKMNYVGNEASMLVVLPNEIEGLGGLLQKLADGYDLLKDVNQMYSTKVRVTLPKFKIETEIDLNTLLPKLGIKQIFNQQNSGLTKVLNAPEPLYVSKAIQKAFIEVNEEGAEAAAATAGSVRVRRSLASVQVFAATRPALWCVLVDRHVTLVASYRPSAPGPRDEL